MIFLKCHKNFGKGEVPGPFGSVHYKGKVLLNWHKPSAEYWIYFSERGKFTFETVEMEVSVWDRNPNSL